MESARPRQRLEGVRRQVQQGGRFIEARRGDGLRREKGDWLTIAYLSGEGGCAAALPQRVAKETTSGGTLWEGFMPQETKAHIAEQAEALVKTISDGRLDRPLLSAVASFLHYPAMASLSRLAYLLKAFDAALKGR